MSEELVDEQSHYEISLTAGQAFVAFVLLLLSLAASFAFGLMIGKGQGDERLVVKHDPAVVTEASLAPKKAAGSIIELGVAEDDFKKSASDSTPAKAAPAQSVVTEGTAASSSDAVASPSNASATEAAAAPKPVESASAKPEAKPVEPKPSDAKPVPAAKPHETAPASGPAFAQLLSTGDQKTAETLAAKVINGGFTSAYVERVSGPKGMIFRVRVKFGSDADAHAAEAKLRDFSNDVWITR